MRVTSKFSFALFIFIALSKRIFLVEGQNTTIPVNVGVILNLDTLNGKMGLSCINMALSDFYSSHGYYKTRLVLHNRDSKSDVVKAAAAALYLIKDVQAEVIIGPQSSMQASFVIDLGEKAQVPVISFSATSPSLTSTESPYFYRVAQNDSLEVKAISGIIQAFGWREVVVIYVDNNYGQGMIPFMTDALQEVGVSVPYRSVIPPSATDDQLGQELYKLVTMQTRVFIVHMAYNLGSRLFTKAKEIGMISEGYVWIIASGLANSLGLIDPPIVDSMQGVLGIKTYIPKTKALEDFTARWKRRFRKDNPIFTNVELNVVGLWAYDAASALARVVEAVGTQNLAFKKTNSSSNLTDLETIGVSPNGPRLQEALSGTRFTGLAGEFSLVNGQLQSTTYQNFDAVVGDVTIIANRSNFVDFTLPYTESGVWMVVPMVDMRKNAWVFLKPLTWDLWMTSGCFFVFIGFVVWLLEHRINDDFRGPPWHQIGTSLWYAFATMVFAHREPVLSNCARFVVIIWVFVVLILTQSYTASLTSLLTVQQLQPTFTDVNQLIANGEYVGVQEGSFVYDILREKKLKNIKSYGSPEECHELFSKGSSNGGISAAFDEFSYVKLFLAKYCLQYKMIKSIYKTDGLGFVFPRGSPLAADVSRAILNVTEGEKMKAIENKWLGNVNNCPDSNPQVTSDSLSLASFWGLFLIAGAASTAALIVSMSIFLYKERRKILIHFDSKGSPWRRIPHAFRIFDMKDLSSHTFRKRGLEDKSGIDSVHSIEPAWNPTGMESSPHNNCPTSPSNNPTGMESSPKNNCPTSPSSYPTVMESHFAFSVGTPSREYAEISLDGQVPQPTPVVEQIGHPNQEGPGSPPETSSGPKGIVSTT